jgi:hypothetical protein
MIHYQLRCDIDHAFDGWFKDSASFDHQAEAGLITCPLCSSVKVARALMAPAVARKGRRPSDIPMRSEAVPGPEHADQTGTMPAVAPPPLSAAVGPPMPDKLRSLLQHLRSEVEKHCDYVGRRASPKKLGGSITVRARHAAFTVRRPRRKLTRLRRKGLSSVSCRGFAGPIADQLRHVTAGCQSVQRGDLIKSALYGKRTC